MEADETDDEQLEGSKQSGIPLLPQPDQLCSCPMQCDRRIDRQCRLRVYEEFKSMNDHALQSLYIQRHIKIKSIAERLWEDEIVDRKILRRVTCRYIVPVTGSVRDSFYYAKTLSYDTVCYALEHYANLKLSTEMETVSKPIQSDMESSSPTINTSSYASTTVNSSYDLSLQIAPDIDKTKIRPIVLSPQRNGITVNGYHKTDALDLSFRSDSKEVQNGNYKNGFVHHSNGLIKALSNEKIQHGLPSNANVRYVEVCQKAFMRVYGIREKRVRWQREKLVLKSRARRERAKKELEEQDRTLAIASALAAGCQPLFNMLRQHKCLQEQLLSAIGDDVARVNDFFGNQLWKPEEMVGCYWTQINESSD